VLICVPVVVQIYQELREAVVEFDTVAAVFEFCSDALDQAGQAPRVFASFCFLNGYDGELDAVKAI
jgi:hypothetical protein